MSTLRKNQRGLSLISLLVALTIGTFLLAGLFDLWLQTKKTFSAQDQLAQVQESQRLATTLLANIVQSGGYFPIYLNYLPYPPPTTPYSLLGSLVAAPNFVAGQSIFGVSNFNAQGDQLSIRFIADQTLGNDNTLDCLGQTEPTSTLVLNTYQIDATGDLTCSVNGGTAQTVVAGTTTAGALTSGIASMAISYGVDTNLVDKVKSTNQYMTATQVTAGNYWTDITSVVVTLNFLNPLYGQPGQTKQYLPIIRTIAITQTSP